MSEHELTEEKIKELWDDNRDIFNAWSSLNPYSRNPFSSFARAAYDLGKAAALKHGAEDDGFIPCEFEDIRKGDTVERTIAYEDGTTEVVTGEADHQVNSGDWYTRHNIELSDGFFNDDATYRRKPAEISPPDPEKHPIILGEDGVAWFWIGAYYRHVSERIGRDPIEFGNDWTPAKVVEKEED